MNVNSCITKHFSVILFYSCVVWCISFQAHFCQWLLAQQTATCTLPHTTDLQCIRVAICRSRNASARTSWRTSETSSQNAVPHRLFSKHWRVTSLSTQFMGFFFVWELMSCHVLAATMLEMKTDRQTDRQFVSLKRQFLSERANPRIWNVQGLQSTIIRLSFDSAAFPLWGTDFDFRSVLKYYLSKPPFYYNKDRGGRRSRCSNSLRAGRSANRIPVETRFPAPLRLALEHTQPPIRWVPGLFPGGKMAGAWG